MLGQLAFLGKRAIFIMSVLDEEKFKQAE